jgi:hypothetical protein
MAILFRLILVGTLLATAASSVWADELRRFIDTPYTCGRDSEGRVLFASEAQKHNYPITAWSDPFTENICTKRSDLPQGCVATELHDFSFQCGSAGTVQIADLYLNSREGKKFGAHREGNQVVLNGGQQRVLISHLGTDCYGKGLSLADLNRCLVSADQYRLEQISIRLPPGRAPLPANAELSTEVIGDDCGSGLYCSAGYKCSAGGGCVPTNTVDCGNGRSCTQGNKCSVGGGCIPSNTVDCGSGRSCPIGSSCGAKNTCELPVAQINQKEPQPPPEPSTPRWWQEPAGRASWGVLALLLYGAIKESLKPKIPPRYRLLTYGGLAVLEWGIYLVLGINVSEPKIIDVISLNVPLLGATIGFGIYAKLTEA